MRRLQPIFCAVALLLVTASSGKARQPSVGLIPDGDIQTSGPVHEAFAQPFDIEPSPGPVVPKKPPEPIPEMPPEERPAGDDYQWIPGYWAWDSERGDYLWISGTYRRTPAGRQYVPGYWTETPEGWRWVAGYWAGANQPDVQYTPEPPAPLENGPVGDGPDNSVYVPGYWNYDQTQFYWRPGFWTAAHPGRMWIAPSYRWTPAGCVFVNGYWDYPLVDRGLLFAPVAFSSPYWNTPGWYYRPAYAVGLGSLLDYLFYRPRWNSFYFGNYFGNRYAGLGYRPWYDARYSPYGSYYRWQNRGNPNWYAGMQNNYRARNDGRMALPPRTLAQQNVALKNIRNSDVPITQVVTPLGQVKNQNIRLTRATPGQLDVQRSSIQRTRELEQTRRTFEARGGAPKTGTAPRTFRLPPNQVVKSSPVPRGDFSKGSGEVRPNRPVITSPGPRDGKVQGGPPRAGTPNVKPSAPSADTPRRSPDFDKRPVAPAPRTTQPSVRSIDPGPARGGAPAVGSVPTGPRASSPAPRVTSPARRASNPPRQMGAPPRTAAPRAPASAPRQAQAPRSPSRASFSAPSSSGRRAPSAGSNRSGKRR